MSTSPPPVPDFTPAPAPAGAGVAGSGGSGGAPPPPPDLRKQAFDFAADATKQLITVATGVVTATAIFSKDLDTTARYWALGSWAVLTLSVLFGLFALLNMTGNLHNSIGKSVPPSLTKKIMLISELQLGAFLNGIIAVMFFGFFAARVKPQLDAKPMTVNCIVPNMPAPVIIQVPAQSAGMKSGTGSGKSSGKK